MRNPIFIITKAITHLSFRHLLQLFSLVGRHPWFSIMGFWATIKAFGIAQQNFPTSASGNGVGNSFRHALWSALIISYGCKISSPQKAKDYCWKMTNLHEELFPNHPLEKQMDLHNNRIGMDLFFEMLPGIHRQFFETSFLVEKLLAKTQTAIIITDAASFSTSEMVYIQDNNCEIA